MKFIFILPSLEVYGAEFVFELSNRLKKHEVFIVSLDEIKRPVDWYPLQNIPIHYPQAVKEFETADIIVAAYCSTAYLLNDLDVKAEKLYLVHEQESKFYTKEMWKKKWTDLNEKRLDIEYNIHKNYIENSLDLPLKYLAVSKGLVDFLKNQHNKKAQYFPIGVNKQLFYPDTGVLKTDKIRIMVNGSGLPWKGAKEVNLALDGIRDIELWTLSDSRPCMKADKHWRNPFADSLRKLLSSCDILINVPYHSGNALLETKAMACGCAVLTTETNGTRDFCTKENSYLVRPKDVKGIHEGIKYLLDKRNREKLVKGGLNTIKTLDWDKSAELLLKRS